MFIVPFVVVIAFCDDIFLLRRRQPERLIIFSLRDDKETLCICVVGLAVITKEEDNEEDNVIFCIIRVYSYLGNRQRCAEQFLCRAILKSLERLSRALFRLVWLLFLFFLFLWREIGSQKAVN